MKTFAFRAWLSLVVILGFSQGQSARADDYSAWQYHADVTVQPQADPTFDAVYADFTHLLKSAFQKTGRLDENSIRVAPLHKDGPGAARAFRFVKAKDYDALANAAGTLIFAVAASPEIATAHYRVYFDIEANGEKPIFQTSIEVPLTANMVWNPGFEILPKDYKGANRYTNKGTNLPVGWWGNLKNSGLTENLATAAHSGNQALGFKAPAGRKNVSISSAPSPPALRVVPGQSYLVSFWVKGEDLTSKNPLTSTIYWYDKTGKYLKRTNIDTPARKSPDFDWTKSETILSAPAGAHFGSLFVGTYSQTGLLMLDDLVLRVAVPPLLGN